MDHDGRSTRRALLSWADDGLQEFPWRDRSRSFYEVFLLTQTPAENAADVYPELCDRYSDLNSLDTASELELESAVEPLGFRRTRAAALSEIAATHDSLPRDGDELRELPRVGPYVADATKCFALAEPVPILDRNVVRVYGRLFGEGFPTADEQRRAFVAELLPFDGERARTYNPALLDLGRWCVRNATWRVRVVPSVGGARTRRAIRVAEETIESQLATPKGVGFRLVPL